MMPRHIKNNKKNYMANTSLNLVDLDFQGIKNSLRNHFRDNELFKDYDWNSAGTNILLELMAYNSNQNAFLTNMLLSEAFLDSAQLRNSVLSHAKELNYLPRSYRSAIANVKVTFEASGLSAPYTIPKGSSFSTLVKNDSYTFSVPEEITVASANSTFEFTTPIYEGSYVTDGYVFQSGIANQRFKITNKLVDTSSLTVTVYEDGDTIGDIYILSQSLLGLDNKSKVYFLQTNQDGSYEVLFGDNNIGRQPKADSIITLNYRNSSGKDANGAREFSIDFDPTGSNELTFTPEVEVLESAHNGDVSESNDSIKYYAPRHFQTQERTVTANDYRTILKQQFREINTVYAYGGEDVDPPQYGKVFCAVDISGISGLPLSKIREYGNFIKQKKPFGIIPEFIEPEFTYISVNTKIRNDLNTSTLKPDTLKSLVMTSIKRYNQENLNDFDTILRASKLSNIIDTTRDSIVSSQTEYLVYKKTNPQIGVTTTIDVDFGVAIRSDIPHQSESHDRDDIHSVISSPFFYNGLTARLEDDGRGNIVVVTNEGQNDEVAGRFGTVNYETGHINISSLKIDSYQGNALKLYIRPKDPDILVEQNNILTIEDDEINITVEEVRA